MKSILYLLNRKQSKWDGYTGRAQHLVMEAVERFTLQNFQVQHKINLKMPFYKNTKRTCAISLVNGCYAFRTIDSIFFVVLPIINEGGRPKLIISNICIAFESLVNLYKTPHLMTLLSELDF